MKKSLWIMILLMATSLSFQSLSFAATEVKKEYYPDGQVWYEIPYKDGKKDGEAAQYYQDRKLWRKLTFREDKLDGLCELYDDLGNYRGGHLLEQLSYKNGKLEGGQRFYDEEDGILKYEIQYKNGRPNGVGRKYHRGHLISELPYKDGKLDGIGKVYYGNGKLLGEAIYKNDKLVGVAKLYYENGALKSTILYKDGRMQRGEVREYDELGRPKLGKSSRESNFELLYIMNEYFLSGENPMGESRSFEPYYLSKEGLIDSAVRSARGKDKLGEFLQRNEVADEGQ